MEIKVTVTHELGEATKAFITGLVSTQSTAAPAAKTAAPSKENTDEEAPAPAARSRRSSTTKEEAPKAKVEEVEEEDEKPARTRKPAAKVEEAEAEDEKPARTRKPAAKVEDEKPAPARTRKPAAKVEEAEDDAPKFEDMTDDEKLDEIKAKITLTTKKKGGADDVRELLGVFDAGRAGELDAKDYDEFYGALLRYRAGESVDEIYPQV